MSFPCLDVLTVKTGVPAISAVPVPRKLKKCTTGN